MLYLAYSTEWNTYVLVFKLQWIEQFAKTSIMTAYVWQVTFDKTFATSYLLQGWYPLFHDI